MVRGCRYPRRTGRSLSRRPPRAKRPNRSTTDFMALLVLAPLRDGRDGYLALLDRPVCGALATGYCNADLAIERKHKRQELLEMAERDLRRIKAAVERKRDPLRGKAEFA